MVIETDLSADYKHCSDNREDWPAILHQYKPTRVDKNPRKPNLWFLDDTIILDPNNKPLLDWPGLPWTISSHVKGVMVEAFTRSNLAISFTDLIARMPKTSSTRLRGNISMRATRFRHNEGLVAWSPRMGSEGIQVYIDLLMGPKRLTANSSYGFPGLQPWERIGINLVNYCKHANRARGEMQSENKKRKLDDVEERRLRYDNLWKEYRELREKAGISNEDDQPTQYLLSLKPKELKDKDEQDVDDWIELPKHQPRKRARKNQVVERETTPIQDGEDLDFDAGFNHDQPILALMVTQSSMIQPSMVQSLVHPFNQSSIGGIPNFINPYLQDVNWMLGSTNDYYPEHPSPPNFIGGASYRVLPHSSPIRPSSSFSTFFGSSSDARAAHTRDRVHSAGLNMHLIHNMVNHEPEGMDGEMLHPLPGTSRLLMRQPFNQGGNSDDSEPVNVRGVTEETISDDGSARSFRR